jgi:hypothetical protein
VSSKMKEHDSIIITLRVGHILLTSRNYHEVFTCFDNLEKENKDLHYILDAKPNKMHLNPLIFVNIGSDVLIPKSSPAKCKITSYMPLGDKVIENPFNKGYN